MTKLTESDIDYAIHTQRLEDCNRIPAGVDQQGRLTTRPYKPSEHVAVDPSWSGQGDTEDPPRPPPEPFDGTIIVAAIALGASVLVLAIIGLGRVVGWVATL